MTYTAPQTARCCAVTQYGEYCRRAPMRSIPPGALDFLPSFIQLCDQHLHAAVGEFDRKREREARARYEAKEQAARDAAVYYAQRRDGLIKIGFTARLQSRMGSIRLEHGPIELLATHKGGRRAEGIQHGRFAEHRVVGEWFYPAPELLEHIARINARRAAAGPPADTTEAAS